MNEKCVIEGCDRDRYTRRKYCNHHYMRMNRYGDPDYKPPRRYIDISGQSFGTLKAVERVGSRWKCECDCGSVVEKSYYQLTKYKRPTCGEKKPHRRNDVSYYTAHQRVESDRGSAKDHICACGEPASQWSYDHMDQDQMLAVIGGSTCAYSVDPKFYVAMCVPCHKKFDLERLSHESR